MLITDLNLTAGVLLWSLLLENGGKLHLEFLFSDFSWPQVVHWPNEPPGLDALWGCSDGIRRKPSGRGTKKQFDLASAKVSPGGVHCAPCRIQRIIREDDGGLHARTDMQNLSAKALTCMGKKISDPPVG